MSDTALLERRIEREKKARQEAERLLEDKSRELFDSKQELEESAARLGAILENTPQGVVTLKEDGVIDSINLAAENIFGCSSDKAVGRPVTDFFTSDMSRILSEAGDDHLYAPGTVEANVLRGEGKEAGEKEVAENLDEDETLFTPVQIFTSRTKIGDQDVYIWLIRDLTLAKQREKEKQDLQQELENAQKLESLGVLAGGIAHEINTPSQYVGDNLRFISGALKDILEAMNAYETLCKAAEKADFLKGEREKVERLIQELDIDFLKEESITAVKQSVEGVAQISHIVRAIKEFSHPGSKSMTPYDINQAVRTTVTVATNQLKYTADVETELDETLPLVVCMPAEINQVLLNMILNATDAMGEREGEGRGKVRIVTRSAGEFNEIEISDQGCGIPEDIIEKIFNPFFTTKEQGKGTGQGLAISHNIIVNHHGGSISCNSKVGEGTTFIIRLPIEGVQSPDDDEDEEFNPDNDAPLNLSEAV